MSKFPLLFAILLAFYVAQPVAAAANVQIQNDSSYINSVTGSYYVVGEVLNTGDVALQYVFVTATLKDSNGVVLSSLQGVAESHYLQPGQKAPFQIIETDKSKASRVATYTLAAEVHPASSPLQLNLAVLNTASSTNTLTGSLHVTGEVRNSGQSVSTYTEVVGTFYDAGGKVVFVGFTFTSPQDIPPGATYSFDMIVNAANQIPKISSWSLFAESQQYTSIPELPWQPVIIAAIVLSFTIMALRKNEGQGRQSVSPEGSPTVYAAESKGTRI